MHNCKPFLMESNPYASGRINQIAGGGEALVRNRFGVGGELSLTVGGGDAASALVLGRESRRRLQVRERHVTPDSRLSV